MKDIDYKILQYVKEYDKLLFEKIYKHFCLEFSGLEISHSLNYLINIYLLDTYVNIDIGNCHRYYTVHDEEEI